jgi:methionyl-tRNA formyltransferase
VPSLEALIRSRHEVVAVVSQPDRGRGRGRKLSPSPVAACALEEGIPVLRPERVGEPEVLEALCEHAPDIGVVVAFGQFIGRKVRELPSLGYMINAHASLLPRYRGASPIAQAILDDEEETGISIMRVEREMDAGPVAHVRRLEIGEQENSAELAQRLSNLAAESILEALDLIVSNEIKWTEQDHDQSTLAPKLFKEDGRLDWRLPTRTLIRRIHGLAPRPGAFTLLPAGEAGEESPLRILRAAPGKGPQGANDPPGTLRRPGDAPGTVQIATGDGWLAPLEVQRAGAKAMPTDAFLRGTPLQDGLRLDVLEKPHG